MAGAGISANQVTVAAFLLSAAYGTALFQSEGASILLIGLPVFLFFRMALNAIDGMLAREFGQKSNLGAILNELTDVLADAALYLPFVVFADVNSALVVVVVLLGIIAEMTGVVAMQIGASRRYDGPFGKSDRAFFFGAVAFAIGIGVSPGVWSTWTFIAAMVLAVVTIINRTRAALNEAE